MRSPFHLAGQQGAAGADDPNGVVFIMLKLAKLATVGIGLAMALTLLPAMTWATQWPAFHPVLLLVY
jgi:hypothetical protein